MEARRPGHLRLQARPKWSSERLEEEPLQQQGREEAKKHRDDEQQPKAHPALPLTLSLAWVGLATLPFMRLHSRLL